MERDVLEFNAVYRAPEIARVSVISGLIAQSLESPQEGEDWVLEG